MFIYYFFRLLIGFEKADKLKAGIDLVIRFIIFNSRNYLSFLCSKAGKFRVIIALIVDISTFEQLLELDIVIINYLNRHYEWKIESLVFLPWYIPVFFLICYSLPDVQLTRFISSQETAAILLQQYGWVIKLALCGGFLNLNVQMFEHALSGDIELANFFLFDFFIFNKHDVLYIDEFPSIVCLENFVKAFLKKINFFN